MGSREDLQQRISYAFGDENLLERALTHRSYANENKLSLHNERMEFLGDAVLNLVVSEALMQTCPDATEGDLSRLRASIVSETALAEVAREIGLGSYLLLGKGEELTGGRNKDSLLANSLEAVIAALYLDGGTGATRAFLQLFFSGLFERVRTQRIPLDYKTELQELCQERLKQVPEYRVTSENGPAHCKQFDIELYLNGDVCGRGSGKSKKEAEQRAAKDALEKFRA